MQIIKYNCRFCRFFLSQSRLALLSWLILLQMWVKINKWVFCAEADPACFPFFSLCLMGHWCCKNEWIPAVCFIWKLWSMMGCLQTPSYSQLCSTSCVHHLKYSSVIPPKRSMDHGWFSGTLLENQQTTSETRSFISVHCNLFLSYWTAPSVRLCRSKRPSARDERVALVTAWQDVHH